MREKGDIVTLFFQGLGYGEGRTGLPGGKVSLCELLVSSSVDVDKGNLRPISVLRKRNACAVRRPTGSVTLDQFSRRITINRE
jgi:hypothetical protein